MPDTRLVDEIRELLRVERAAAPGSIKLTFSWTAVDLDLPSACNYLVRAFKVPAAAVLTRRFTRYSDEKTATLRLSGMMPEDAEKVLEVLHSDLHALAESIIIGGT